MPEWHIKIDMDNNMQEFEGRPRQPAEPVSETDTSVAYLGVKLDKARVTDSQFVPQKDQYADFINDRFSLDLQKNIAVSFQAGDPLLIEGGTSIGKTTTVRKMASELGWEVHYANLNGASDVEDLMGRYIPNPNRHGPDDPEYTFADGKVTSGLRVEEGKVKVIILDEYNSAAPNIVIRLHEVLDALQRGENVVLSEDASEAVAVDKKSTKIVALMNPPGKGYIGREPIDPAQLRRWVYYKAPSELPPETFSYSTDALFGLAPQDQEVPQIAFLNSRDEALLPEQLRDVPGMQEISDKYKEFHQGAKGLVTSRRIAADQPQPFTYDDRMEPRRVRDFVMRFYNGDINGTFQDALRYYYVNKVEDPSDRDQLEELIRHVEYTPSSNVSRRRGVERDEQEPIATEPMVDIPESAPVGPESAPVATGEVQRKEQEAWSNVLGARVDVAPLPDYVTPDVKRKLEELGFGKLIYIPKLDLKTASHIGSVGVDSYLKELQRRYPKWKPVEDLSDSEKRDHTVPRNLEEWYWQNVGDGNIDFPSLKGQWMAVETVDKPKWGDSYPDTPFARKIGQRGNRFSKSWNTINGAIEKEKAKVIRELGLSGRAVDLRQLEALEWNLAGNREGWGKTDSYEWTNTEYRVSGDSYRVLVGYSAYGGAGLAVWYHPDLGDGAVGWRAAVVLGS